MYIDIRHYKMDPDVIDDVLDLARNEFLPKLAAIPGFKAFYHIRAGEDALTSVSVFEDKAGADESNRLALECVKEHASDLLLEPPEIVEGEVATYELAQDLITSR